MTVAIRAAHKFKPAGEFMFKRPSAYIAFLSACSAFVLPVGAAPAQAADAPRNRPYTLNPGDEIEVFVFGEDRLSRALRILPDGTFSFPLVGRVDAQGKTPTDLETAISAGLAKQYRETVPQVTVSVKAPSGFQFSVIGKVKAPGTFAPGRYLNALQALAEAGGPAEFANVDNTVIIRKTGSSLKTIRVRLSGALKGQPSNADLSSGGIPEIESGDTVIVP
jgi:polysaccharide biosynthesis/export protein